MAFVITVPYHLTVRDAGLPRAMGFLLRHQYTVLQFVQASLHIAQCVWHHGEHHPYLPSRQPGRSTVRCQWRSVLPCPVDRNSPPVAPFQCYPVNVHHFAVFHGSPRQEDRSHTVPRAVGWPLASSIQWSLRLFSLLGILPVTPVVLLFILFLTPVVFLFTLSPLSAEPRVGKA